MEKGEEKVREFMDQLYAPTSSSSGRVREGFDDESEMALFNQAARSLK